MNPTITLSYLQRISIAVIIGLCSAVMCYLVNILSVTPFNDFFWSLRAARDLLAGQDPYTYQFHANAIPYPLTAAIVAIPFCWLPNMIAGATFIGMSTGLLAFGFLRMGEPHRLLVLGAFPYWWALLAIQWSPLLFAVYLLPALLPLTLCKPHTGLPVLLTRLTRPRLLACAIFGLITLLIYPTWPWVWLSQIGEYGSFIPLLTFPGFLLALVAIPLYQSRGRDERARLLALLALVPQRFFYDQFLLWLIPSTTREILFMVLCSWIPVALRLMVGGPGSLYVVVFMYIPALIIVALQKHPLSTTV